MIKNKIRTIALSLAVTSIVTMGFIFTTPITAECASCICAERINWLGQCRGETIRLCKGGSQCTSCGQLTPDFQ